MCKQERLEAINKLKIMEEGVHTAMIIFKPFSGGLSEQKERKELLKTHSESTQIQFKCSRECSYVHSIIVLTQFKRKPRKRKLYAQLKGNGTYCKKCDRIISIKIENILDYKRSYIPKNSMIYG